jgi:hypothetical protein
MKRKLLSPRMSIGHSRPADPNVGTKFSKANSAVRQICHHTYLISSYIDTNILIAIYYYPQKKSNVPIFTNITSYNMTVLCNKIHCGPILASATIHADPITFVYSSSTQQDHSSKETNRITPSNTQTATHHQNLRLFGLGWVSMEVLHRLR